MGRQCALAWSTFADRVKRAKPGRAKETLARWAPVEFRGGRRCLANVLRAHAVVLDVDDGSKLARVLRALDGIYTIAHSTFSATAQHPRWRIVVPLDWPVDASEYDRVWRWLASKLEAVDIQPDYGARDASRAWAVPARPPSGFYIAHVAEGAFAERTEALAAIPEPAPLPEPDHGPRDETYAHRVERASRYLATMPGAISGSGGHATTFAAALVLVRGFGLEHDDALRLLTEVHNPLCAPEWSQRELVHKIRQAYQRGRLPFGWLADRQRDGRAA